MQPTNEFQDPELKKAVCRCWGCDCASAELRKRVSALFQTEEPMRITPQRVRPHYGRRMAWVIGTLAAAAVVVLSFSLFNRIRPKTDSTVLATALPVDLESALIKTHDGCCELPNHQGIPVPKDDDSAIASAMHDTLHRPILMIHPDEAGWSFHGAAFCPVGGVKSGHLVFGRGDERLSVFSLPKSMLPSATEGSEFAGTYQDHCIVGFVKDGALFCAVETGPAGTISLSHLEQLSEEMKPAVAVAASPAVVRGGDLAELLRPETP